MTTPPSITPGSRPSSRFRALAFVFLALSFSITPHTAPAQDVPVSPDTLPRLGAADVVRPVTGLSPSETILLPEFAPATPGDEDIGVQPILRGVKVYRPFSLWLAPAVFWTDNAALTETDEDEDVYFSGYLGGAYTPRLRPDLYLNLNASHRIYRYDDRSDLDFDTTEAGAGITKVFPDLGNLSLYGRYNYERFVEPREWTELFAEHSFVLGLFKSFDLARSHLAYVRIRTQLSLATNPDILRSHEYSSTLGYRYTIADPLNFELFYRARLSDYRRLDGNDLNHQVGANLSYAFNQSVSLIASSSIAVNDSGRLRGDYTSSQLGGLLSLQFKF